jgi:transketolase
MASLEKMKIIVPADPVEGAIVAEYALAEEGPVYIRLGRTGEPVIHSKRPLIEIGKGLTLQTGEKVAVIATGSMVKECMDSAEILRGSGIDITLINMHTIKPIDGDLVREVGENHEFIFTVEEHNIHGGLGSMVGNLLAEQGYGGYFRRIGIRPFQKRLIGDCEYLRRECGLCSETIAHNITSIVKR